MPRQNNGQVSCGTFFIALGTAFLVKIFLLLVVLPFVSEHISPFYGIGFADDYDKIAINIAQGNGYRFYPDTAPTIMREPGYPLLLSAVFALFGYSLPAARLLNALLAVAGAGIIAVLAGKVSKHWAVIVGAPLLFLFHPGTMVAESRGGFEIFFIFSLLLFFLVLYKALADGRTKWFALAGIVLGWAVLIRSTFILFPLFLLLYLWLFRRDFYPGLAAVGRVVAMTGAMLFVISPWVARNYAVVEKLVPTTSVQGIAAHAGQYICQHLTFDNEFQQLDSAAAQERIRFASELGYAFRGGYYQYFFDTADEVEFSNHLVATVLREYAKSPGLVIKCASANLFNFWFAGKNWRATVMNVLVQLPLLVLAAGGLWCARRAGRWSAVAPMALAIAYLMLLHAPIHAQARYSVPLVPFIAILGCYGLACIATAWRTRKDA